MQARLAITDRLAFVASQDGYTFLRADNPLVPEADGFMDLMAGFKYALIENEDQGFILTPSLRFHLPVGRRGLFQGLGDGAAVLGTSVGWAPGERLGAALEPMHVISQLGFSIPFSFSDSTSFLHWNVQVNYAVSPFFVPFIGFNGITYLSDGDGDNGINVQGVGRVPLGTVQSLLGTGGFEGLDVANLGSDDVAGNTVITIAAGARIPIGDHWSIGAAYERPISSRKGIFGQRVSLAAQFTF